jgi:cellulose synthase (UDP-forming)
VDVFIPTYNEGLDVLEKTVVGAKHLDYPNFKVWVLDDGKRSWLKDFCDSMDVGYLTRPDNSHAKAGNLNNGLRHTSGELFAIFDADFVPATNFLKRTVGFFLHHEDIGIVQTPQHFFNKDPIQSNLYLDKVWPDEQRLFFDAMAPCRDGWNAAFCCGSCSIIRRKAIDAVGGIPTSSITEDLLTTLSLLTVGYRTVYLNEKLSQGMSAESVKAYFIQRSRWCRGGIQCFFVKEGPVHSKGLSLLQRILFTPYGWVAQPITRLMLLVVPIVYLWFGVAPLHFTNTIDIFAYQAPMLLMFVLTMHWLAPNKYIPIVSTAIGVFSMFRLLPVVVSSVIKPFGEPFRVTPKGSGSSTGVDWFTLGEVLVLIALTLGGILINLVPEYQVLRHMQFFPYAIFWSGINILILFICVLICFDIPRKRREERFIIEEPTVLEGVSVVIEDLSLGGSKIRHGQGKRIFERDDVLTLPIEGVSESPKIRVKNSNATHLMAEFIDQSPKQREELIAKLFTGRYDNEIHEAKHYTEVLQMLFRRAFGRELT